MHGKIPIRCICLFPESQTVRTVDVVAGDYDICDLSWQPSVISTEVPLGNCFKEYELM